MSAVTFSSLIPPDLRSPPNTISTLKRPSKFRHHGLPIYLLDLDYTRKRYRLSIEINCAMAHHVWNKFIDSSTLR